LSINYTIILDKKRRYKYKKQINFTTLEN